MRLRYILNDHRQEGNWLLGDIPALFLRAPWGTRPPPTPPAPRKGSDRIATLAHCAPLPLAGGVGGGAVTKDVLRRVQVNRRQPNAHHKRRQCKIPPGWPI